MANAVRDRLHSRVFHAVHRNNLLYNTCWEDPALDRVALRLSPADRLLVITSAGCNASADVTPILEIANSAAPASQPNMSILY